MLLVVQYAEDRYISVAEISDNATRDDILSTAGDLALLYYPATDVFEDFKLNTYYSLYDLVDVDEDIDEEDVNYDELESHFSFYLTKSSVTIYGEIE